MLLWGAKHGHSQFVRRMLREFNIDVNVRSHKSEASPLHLAAAQGNYDTVTNSHPPPSKASMEKRAAG
jgi:ankyrin repeat protein